MIISDIDLSKNSCVNIENILRHATLCIIFVQKLLFCLYNGGKTLE